MTDSPDTLMRDRERTALTTDSPEAAAALRVARIRAGLEPYPQGPTYPVLDPLHTAGLRKHVARLAKVATRRGLIPLALLESEPRWQDVNGRLLRVRDCTLVGDVADTGDWHYVARLDHSPDGTKIMRAPWRPDQGEPMTDATLERYRAKGPWCDHCAVRRARHDTYVMRHKHTLETVQLGRQCLESYTGGSPDAALFALDTLAELTATLAASGELRDAPTAPEGRPLVRVLSHMLASPALAPELAWDRADTLSQAGAERAMTILADASAALLPALAHERALRTASDAGQPAPALPPGVTRLPERLHNVSVLVSEGVVERSTASLALVATLRHWWTARQPRDTGAAYTAMRVTLNRLGCGFQDTSASGEVVTLRLDDLAKAMAKPEARAAALALLAALAPPTPVDNPPMATGASGAWSGTVEAVRPYRSGAGAVVRVLVDAPGGRPLTVFVSGRPAAGVVEGATVLVSGTVQRGEHCPYTRRDVYVMSNDTTVQ